MSLQLPGALVWVLDLLGFTWPAADEDKLREAAAAWRDFARDTDSVRTTAAGVMRQVVQDNYGKDIDALIDYWNEFDGGSGHLSDAAQAARLAADMLDGFAVATEAAKYAMIAQLAVCAAEIAAAQAAAPVTFGLSELGALGATQASRIAIRRIVKEKIEDVVQHELAHKLRTVLKEVFEKILRAARHKVDDLKQYVDDAAGRLGGPQLAHATTGGASVRSGVAQDVRAENIKKGIPESRLGPSGKPKIHVTKHATRKQAKDAAHNKGKGRPVHHPSPERGGPHYHPVDQSGNKIPGPHEEYPK